MKYKFKKGDEYLTEDHFIGVASYETENILPAIFQGRIDKGITVFNEDNLKCSIELFKKYSRNELLFLKYAEKEEFIDLFKKDGKVVEIKPTQKLLDLLVEKDILELIDD